VAFCPHVCAFFPFLARILQYRDDRLDRVHDRLLLRPLNVARSAPRPLRETDPAPPQMAQQPRRYQGLAAARGRRGEDQPAPGHAAGSPSQSSAARIRTTSPIAMIVGPSIPDAAAAAAASVKVDTSTR
jgi:hypothetical protein